jgi:general L-amino acid transport system substrate-binding protein
MASHRQTVIAAMMGLALGISACGKTDRTETDETNGDTSPLAQAGPRSDSPTLNAVKRRGRLNCGVHEGLIGFAYTDNRGVWRGFDVDFCRAMAAAVLGDPQAVRFVPIQIGDRFEALNSGRIDVLWRNTSWTLARDAGDGLEFAGINYYDGQGFLVRRSLNLTSATELNGARICVQRGSTTELNLADYFGARGLRYTPVLMDSETAAREAYGREDCDAFTGDVSALASGRTTLPNPQSHAILPDIISKEPLGPVVRRGDDQWTDIVRWTLNSLILAEELGVTADNARSLAEASTDPRVRRLLGVEGEYGAMLGLSESWASDAIVAVGNYGEIFDRNLGSRSPLDLARGLNAQWNATPAGQIYALPIR